MKNLERTRQNPSQMQLMQLNATQFQLLKIMLWLLAQAAQSLGMVIVITCLSQDPQAKTLKQVDAWCMEKMWKSCTEVQLS